MVRVGSLCFGAGGGGEVRRAVGACLVESFWMGI